jgi:hypothetical protein
MHRSVTEVATFGSRVISLLSTGVAVATCLEENSENELYGQFADVGC